MALHQMAPLKLSDPDGFGAYFYQDHWSLMAEEVCSAMLSVPKGEGLDPFLKFTYIVLIPKVKTSNFVSDFRPINLYNVLYKVITKVLANRLKKVLSFIISKNQSAFSPRKLLSDNVMVAYEMLHSMRSRQKGKTESMAIKFDMSKVYDHTE